LPHHAGIFMIQKVALEHEEVIRVGEVSLKGFNEPERIWKVTQTPRP
jgi:hypothetical protein